jgi:hypothetical protein
VNTNTESAGPVKPKEDRRDVTRNRRPGTPPLDTKRDTYRGWSIDYDPKPIPIRDFDWMATHPDYDASWEGEEDGWVDNGLKVSAATREALCEEIDAAQDEWNETNGQFGVGA